jgi:FkbM family methyltransferase
MILSQHVKTVHAFEPNPPVFNLLKRNIEANGLTNVIAHQKALADTPGKMKFVGSSAFGHLNSVSGDGVAVEVDTIDRVVKSLGLGHIAAMKIDIEGFEPFALGGARQTLRRKRPPVVYMEFNTWCLMRYGRVNPADFAEALFRWFGEVSLATKTGATPFPHNAAMLHHNIKRVGGIFDLILTRPTGSSSPLTGANNSTEIAKLRRELAALRKSKSWAMTKPLRAIGRLLRR